MIRQDFEVEDNESVERCNELMKAITDVRSGDYSIPITLELLDPRGHSKILHSEAIFRQLEEHEIEDLALGFEHNILEP